jgi:arachidonate 15-lipoxygenase
MMGGLRWYVRRKFWNLLGWIKMSLNKPMTIPLPPKERTPIRPVPLGEAVPALPIRQVLVCPPDAIPPDERSRAKTLVYKLQVALYTIYPPMQPGLPPIPADPIQALKQAFTRLHRSRYSPPVLPAEYLGSPDLGSLAVRGPYACYTRGDGNGGFEWDLRGLEAFEHHPGLHTLGARVRFRVDPARRALQAVRIESSLGTVGPEDAAWELSKKLALCSATTHLSLVRHFNWVHLACAAQLAVATRNQLPAQHPVCRLVWPFVYGAQQSNDIVTRGQMMPGGEFETIFSFSFDGLCALFDATYGAFDMATNDPQADARARGLDDAGFDTPSQDNLRALFEPMLAYARDALRHVYADEPAGSGTVLIRNDTAVMAWLDELNRLVPNGVGLTRDNVDFEGLARLVARTIYMASVQHEWLGSFVWNYQLWTHRQPVRVYLNGQREPLDVYQRLVNANYNLNVRRRALIDDFGYLALDEAGRGAIARFQRALEALQADMEREPWVVWRMYPRMLKVNINA